MSVFVIGNYNSLEMPIGKLIAKKLNLTYKTNKDFINSLSIGATRNYVIEDIINPKQFIRLFNEQTDSVLLLEDPFVKSSEEIDFFLESVSSYLNYLVKIQTINEARIVTEEITSKPATKKTLEDITNNFFKNIKRSVAILIKNPTNGLYLGVSRKYDSNDMGLIGGKNNFDESDIEAAIRETKEETGLDIFNLKPVFADFVQGNKIYWCTTFVADFKGEIFTNEKGVVAWVDKQKLLAGSFGDYNRKLFENIGI